MSTLQEAIGRTTLERVRAPGAVDAVVIGAGATGSLAAQLLTAAGLSVLVLNAGIVPSRPARLWRRCIRRATRQIFGGDVLAGRMRRRQPIQSQCYAWSDAPDAFVDDIDCPYVAASGHPFMWFRSRQIGGRMVNPRHGRQYYRLNQSDFDPNDGLSPRWPLAHGELEPWYDVVERQLGLAGRYDGNPYVPDSRLAQVIEPSRNEVDLIQTIRGRWPNAAPMLGRFAAPQAALNTAAASGRLLLRTGAVASSIDVDHRGHVSGVRWRDQRSRREVRVGTPLVILCASALESTRLLLLSRSSSCPSGLGANSGVLGRHLMDHIRVRVWGVGPPLEQSTDTEPGRCVYVPRFDVRDGSASSGRGFGVQIYRSNRDDGGSHFGAFSFGEMLPRRENRVVIDESRRDAWGIPVLRIDCCHSGDDLERGRAQLTALNQLAAALNVEITRADAVPAPPGSANHECGTARMGDSPDNSVVDPNNECWDARGLYLVDGACLPSQGIQNPTLTMLAVTARACGHAVGMRTLAASGSA